MYSSAWRLTHDEDARRFADLQYRTRTLRQVWFARAAIAYREQQAVQRGIFHFIHNTPRCSPIVVQCRLFMYCDVWSGQFEFHIVAHPCSPIWYLPRQA